MSIVEKLDLAAAAVRRGPRAEPVVGVVLGSGLGAWGDTLGSLSRIPYTDIPHMAASTVVGHAGNLCLGEAGGVSVACLQGRVHLYEGHEPSASCSASACSSGSAAAPSCSPTPPGGSTPRGPRAT